MGVQLMMAELIEQLNLQGIDMTGFFVVLILIIFDIVTGLLKAGVDKNINSKINFEGLLRKVGELVAFFFLVFMDRYLGTDGFITKMGLGMMVVYEVTSIIENFSGIGINLSFITQFFQKDGDKRDK